MAFFRKLKDALTGAGVPGAVRDPGMASEQRSLDRITETMDPVATLKAIIERLEEVADRAAGRAGTIRLIAARHLEIR